MLIKRIYDGGMTTTSGGNLSVLDEDNNLWITPGGIDKGTLTRADIIRVAPDGSMTGPHKPSVELPFHKLIYKTRPDIRAIIHAHPPGLVAFSNVRKIPDTGLIPNMRLVSGNVGMAEYEIPGSKELGEKIAAKFAEGCDAVMLENHGVVVGSGDLFGAFVAFETLEYCARLEINARRIGTTRGLGDREIAISKNKQDAALPEFAPAYHSPAENAARRDICALIQRAYTQKLFTSSQGTFSQRIGADSFVITPYEKDRRYLDIADLVLIEGGKKEEGKRPSRSVALHRHIYQKHPEINAVIIAHPPHIMAFAVTGIPFDTATIPESYIMLRRVPVLPFGSSFMQPAMTADLFGESAPAALIENHCIITTGESLIKAFDRLEVAEFTANSLIASAGLGKIVGIDDAALKKIDEVFFK